MVTRQKDQNIFLNFAQRTYSRRSKALVSGSVLCFLTWILLTEAAQAAEITHHSGPEELWHSLRHQLYELMAGLWIFVLGSCIGSFLNVVIYRMPAGKALSHPGSRCPFCETELTARDNIPILGWLTLRGRCRYCQVPISSRYPLIEFTVGILFLIVLFVETGSNAANLPLSDRIGNGYSTFELIVQQGRGELLGWFIAHTFYLTVVLALCMIGLDGHAPPNRLVALGAAAGLILGILWPELRPVHVIVPLPETIDRFWGIDWTLPPWLGGSVLVTGISLPGSIDGLAGAVSGLMTGWLAARTVSQNRSLALTVRSLFLLTGVFCGWQMTWALLAIAVAAIGLLKRFAVSNLQKLLPLFLFVTCCTLILCWDQLLNGTTLPSYNGWRWTVTPPWIDWVATVALLTAASVFVSRIGAHQADSQSQQPQIPPPL